jgi:ATP-binding cassette subfamily F protein 3
VRRSASTQPVAAEPTARDAEARRRAFETDKAQQRATERKRRRLEELEGEIARGEADLGRLRDQLRQDPGGDWAKLAEKAKKEQALAKRVDQAMAEWMALSEELGQGGS